MALPEKFLRTIWSAQPKPGYAFLSVKDWTTGEWTDHSVERLDPKIPTTTDLYFAPNLYEQPRRRKSHCLPGRWLYADLDEVNPEELAIQPTVAWETSPGRWQALWLLAAPLRPAALGRLNQKLTYFCDADKGGWSLTKVLRVPGSVSTKHGKPFTIDLLWANGPKYQAAELYDLVKKVSTPQDEVGDLPVLTLPKAPPRRILQRREVKLSTRQLARAQETDGQDRSAVLWKLERELLEQGCTPEETFVVCRASVWNKYKGQNREARQLWTEIQRAVKTGGSTSQKRQSAELSKQKGNSNAKSSSGLQLTRASDLLREKMKKPDWLVEGVWSEFAHGIIAGPPKTYKSVISMDLAVSVASGTPFLGHFPIPRGRQGPVFLIQKENDPGEVQDRLEKMYAAKGLMDQIGFNGSRELLLRPGPDLELYISNNPDFDLTDAEDINRLRRKIRKLQPVLVVLDPLYLMASGVDENSAHEMTPVLERLLRIKQRYSCGTLIIHHFKKVSAENPVKSMIERISGTGVFGRWYESALLLDRPDDVEPTVRIWPVHRGHRPQGVIEATFDLGDEERFVYRVHVDRPRERAAEQYDELRDIVSKAGAKGIPVTELMEQTGMTRKTLERKIANAGLRTMMVKGRGQGGHIKVVKKPQED